MHFVAADDSVGPENAANSPWISVKPLCSAGGQSRPPLRIDLPAPWAPLCIKGSLFSALRSCVERLFQAGVEHGIAFFCEGVGLLKGGVGFDVAAHADVAAGLGEILEQTDGDARGGCRAEARGAVGEGRYIVERDIADIGEDLLPEL